MLCNSKFIFMMFSFSTFLQAGVVELATDAEFSQWQAHNKPVLVMFSATWCGACDRAKPLFEEISNDVELKDIPCVHIDIDKHSALADQFHIQSIPTFIVIQGVDSANILHDVSLEAPHFAQAIKQGLHLSDDVSSSSSELPAKDLQEKHQGCCCMVQGLLCKVGSIAAQVYEKILSLFMYLWDMLQQFFAPR